MTKMSDSRMLAVDDCLRQARSVWRAIDVGSGILRAITVLLLILLGGLVADNVFTLPEPVRLGFAVLFLAAFVYLMIIQTVFRMSRPLNDEMVARHVERKYPNLDNRLINAVLLHKERISDPVTRTMVASQLDETVSAVRKCDMVGSTDTKPLWRWGKWVIALTGFALIYGIAFSRHFNNAVQRFAHPTAYIPPITDTILTVAPGNAERLEGDILAIQADVKGVLPDVAHIYIDDPDAETVHRTMPFEGSCFVFEFSNLQKGFMYWVKAGDATSQKFQVTVRTRPRMESLNLCYNYPEYTGLKQKTEQSESGNISAVVDTQVTLTTTVDRPLSKAVMQVTYLGTSRRAGPPETVEIPMKITPKVVGQVTKAEATADIKVERPGNYRILVEDEAKIPNLPVTRQISAQPDEPPFVKVVEPAKDITLMADGSVYVVAEAKDDFSLKGLKLLVQTKSSDDWKEYRAREFPSTKEYRDAATITVAEFKGQVGDVISYFFRADDGRPGRHESDGTSRIYQISIVDKNVAAQQDQMAKEALRTLLAKLLALQKANLSATQRVGGWVESGKGEIAQDADNQNADRKKQFDDQTSALVKAEEEIYTATTKGVTDLQGTENADALAKLANLAAMEMTRAVAELKTLKKPANSADIQPVAAMAIETEKDIVAKLEALLENVRTAAVEDKDQKKEKKLSEMPEDLTNKAEIAEKLTEKLQEFAKDQQDVIKATKQLADIAADDLTKEDEEKFTELAEKELEWGKYFKEAATDLSKLPPQSAELATMAKEFLEVAVELETAADALSKKAAEMATAMEESGNGQAKEITENMEKWLPEARDSDTWKMEGLDTKADQALAPLPDELEDLIGELLDKEDELMEDADDATSDSLSSMDKGIGWDAMDGPMANMSAKGITGNRLPNANEMGGRSGEGRSGKSSGQFVEEEAFGKGGRQTPTRNTPTPYEAGTVKDHAPEPGTGATGGGKRSGAGQEGLLGQAPPSRGKLKRLANVQQNLIEKARRLDRGLEKYNYPRGDLPKTIELMEQVRSELEGLGEGEIIPTAGKTNRRILQNLQEMKDLVEKQKKLSRDNTALMPKELRDEIASSQREGVPREYQDMVDSYFRALSESANR